MKEYRKIATVNAKLFEKGDEDALIQLTKDLDNVYMKNKLRYVKKLLITEWNESDLFLEQLEKEVHFNNSNLNK